MDEYTPDNESQGWENDVTSLVQLLSSDSHFNCSDYVNDSGFFKWANHINSDFCVPSSKLDDRNLNPSRQLDAQHALDSPRCQPENKSEAITSKTLRRVPGSSPDEQMGSTPVNNITSQQGERYSTSHAAIKNYTQMVKSMWPDITKAAESKYPDFTADYTKIKDTALPNFLGARLPVTSGLIIENWRKYLKGYHDQNLCDFLQFGWPLGYVGTSPPKSVLVNHPSATAHTPHVEKFIRTELGHGALLGPFEDNQFEQWTRISPLMTRSKKDSSYCRIIVDLSFPSGD